MTPNPNENPAICPNCGKPGAHFVPHINSIIYTCKKVSHPLQPNENQEKHSAEPFQVTLIENPAPIFYIQDGNGVDVCKFNPFNKDKANASHIVECVNFCAGVSHERMAAFKPLKDLIDINRDQNLELKSLRTELSTLRKELEAAKKAQGWTETLTQWLLERLSLTARSAKEWNESEPGCGQSIWREGMGVGLWEAQTALQRLQRGEDIMDDFEDTRLNNGKDGAILERIEKEKK